MPSPRSGRTLSSRYALLIAMAGLAGAGTLACGSGDGGTGPIPPPPPAVTVVVTPTTAGLVIGETVTLVAMVSNSTTAPTWTSSASGVATVSAAGLVTAVTAGTTTITAAVGSASAAALITVTTPAVAIGGITQNGQPVNLANLSGVISIAVTANLPADFSGTIEARLGGVVIGSTALAPLPAPAAGLAAGPALAPRQTVVEGKTTTTQVVSGEELAKIPNGNRLLEILALTPGGSQVAVSPPTSTTVANQNVVVIRGTQFSGNIFVDGQSYTWGQGNMNFRANYINYEGGPTGTFTGLSGSIQTPGGPIQINVTPASSLGLHANFTIRADVPPPGGLLGVEGELKMSAAFLQLIGSPTPTSFGIGNNTPNLFSDPPVSSWYPDNAGPTTTGLPVSDPFYVNDTWQINEHWSLNYDFRYQADANGPATVTDGGSGFQGGSWTVWDALEQVLMERVVSGADLPPTNGYDLFLGGVAEDWVGNTSIWPLSTPGGSPVGIGTDFIPPTADLNPAAFWLQHNEINPLSGSWRIDLDDPPNSLGGFSGATNDMNFSLTRTLDGLSDEDACPVGTHGGGLCTPVRQTISSGLLQLQPGWKLPGKYRASLQAIDHAGNLSEFLNFFFFTDLLPTVITLPFGPPTIPGGIEMPFGASFADDVDLFSVEGSLRFDNALIRVGVAPVSLGNPYSQVINRRYDSNIPMRTYRSLEGVEMSSPFAPTGMIHPLTEYYAGARDVGGNLSGTFLDLSGRSTPATTSFGATGQDWFDMWLSAATVCDPSDGHACGSIPTSVQAQARGFIPNNGNMIPITELRFFAIIPSVDGAKVAVPIGGPAVRMIKDMGSYFEYNWDATLQAADFPPCTQGIAAIGQDAMGAGLHTNITPISFFDAPGPVDLSPWRPCLPY